MVLKVSQLTKIFYPNILGRIKGTQPFHAVKGISFEVEKSEIVGLLGPNGAGKTTTMHMLLATLNPTSGSIEYFGKNLLQHRSEILQKIGFASTYIHLPEHLTIEENLEVYGRIFGLSSKERKKNIDTLLQQFGINKQRKKLVGSLSAGQVTRTMLAKAFLTNPKIVLLDEPTAALDPDIAQDLRAFILNQQEDHGTTILLASHNMEEVTEMCDRVLVLQKGTIIDQDTPQNLAKRMHLCRLGLLVENIPGLLSFAQSVNLTTTLEGHFVVIDIDEQKIASFLRQLAQKNIEFSQIYIKHPSLEDYFIEIAREGAA